VKTPLSTNESGDDTVAGKAEGAHSPEEDRHRRPSQGCIRLPTANNSALFFLLIQRIYRTGPTADTERIVIQRIHSLLLDGRDKAELADGVSLVNKRNHHMNSSSPSPKTSILMTIVGLPIS
jgi:hypothetical protein